MSLLTQWDNCFAVFCVHNLAGCAVDSGETAEDAFKTCNSCDCVVVCEVTCCKQEEQIEYLLYGDMYTKASKIFTIVKFSDIIYRLHTRRMIAAVEPSSFITPISIPVSVMRFLKVRFSPSKHCER